MGTSTPENYPDLPPLSLPDASPICPAHHSAGSESGKVAVARGQHRPVARDQLLRDHDLAAVDDARRLVLAAGTREAARGELVDRSHADRKSTRLNSSHKCASRMPSSA